MMRFALCAAVAAAALFAADAFGVSANNCPGAGGTAGVNCSADLGLECCGSGTMVPSCVNKTSGNQCCRHYLASGQCNATSTCCGGWGPGASSYTFCCGEGSKCCSDGSTSSALCCPEESDCCPGTAFGGAWCCAKGTKCNATQRGQCDPK